MQGADPPKIIERKECKHLLERIGCRVDAAQIIVQDHGFDTAEKLRRLKPDNVNILIKTLRALGGECSDGIRDPGISIPHSTHKALILACFIRFHHVWCDLCPSLNLLDADVIHKMDLQQSREDKHNNNLFLKDQPSGILQTPSNLSQTSGGILSPSEKQTRPLVHICSISILFP